MMHVLKGFAETFRWLANVLMKVLLIALEMVMVQYAAMCQQSMIHVITVGRHVLTLILKLLVALDASMSTFHFQQLHQQQDRQPAPPPPPPPLPPPPAPACFPSSSKVTVAGGKTVTMSELKIGDKVLAGMRNISVSLYFFKSTTTDKLIDENRKKHNRKVH